jgi:hypothetical protein
LILNAHHYFGEALVSRLFRERGGHRTIKRLNHHCLSGCDAGEVDAGDLCGGKPRENEHGGQTITVEEEYLDIM